MLAYRKAEPQAGLSDSHRARHTVIFSSGMYVPDSAVLRQPQVYTPAKTLAPLQTVPQSPMETNTTIFCASWQERGRGPGKRLGTDTCFSRKTTMAAAVALHSPELRHIHKAL